MKKGSWVNWLILALIVSGAVFRLKAYGDLRLSIGTRDSEDYIQASRAPLFSWDAFTGKRLFGTNLLFKLAKANGPECTLTIISKPAENNEEFRGYQSCFDRVVLIQHILGVICWSALAWLFARRMNSPFTKILSTLLLLAFAYVPQIAEWDSVLSSESLAFSLFALYFGLFVEISMRIVEDRGIITKGTITLTVFFLLVFGLWTFERDANLYTTPITIVMIAALFLFKQFRKSKYLFAILGTLGIFLFIGLSSSAQSVRWHLPLEHSFETYIYPYPARVEFFQKFGMPIDPTSQEYLDWRAKNAPRVYLMFLLSHPGFVTQTLWLNFSYFTVGHFQHYFVSPELPFRDTLLTLGEFLHPETGGIFLLDIVMVASLIALAWRRKDASTFTWAWIALWFIFSTALTLFMNFFGDVSGALRHVTPPVAMFRLMIWVFLLIHMDMYYLQEKQSCLTV